MVTEAESASSSVDDKVRILVLDQENWRELPQPLQLTAATAYFSIGEFLAIENERMIPQQAASTLTNIDDIESLIRSVELERGKTYLSAIDLPKRDRNKVIRELGYMGISAGSLIPGLDGACEELADRNFRCS